MDCKNLTQLISSNTNLKRYYLSLPVEIRLELHKYNDTLRSESAFREKAAEIGHKMHYNESCFMPHEYSLY